MLDDKYLQEIQTMISSSMKESESRMMAYFDAAVMPKFDLLADGQKTIMETLAPKSKVEELEEEVAFLKSIIRLHSEDIAKLKKAQ